MKRTFYNPSNRRKGKNGAKGWIVLGIDIDGNFRSQRISTLEAIFSKPQMWVIRRGVCVECGRECAIKFEKHWYQRLRKKPNIIHDKCKWNLP